MEMDNELIHHKLSESSVDDLVIADPKVVTVFNDTHLAQMVGYLNITGLRLALLLNFKHSKLQWKRVVH
jgi:GxxExxY protein